MKKLLTSIPCMFHHEHVSRYETYSILLLRTGCGIHLLFTTPSTTKVLHVIGRFGELRFELSTGCIFVVQDLIINDDNIRLPYGCS